MGFAKLAASFLRSPGPGLTMMPKMEGGLDWSLYIEFWIWIGLRDGNVVLITIEVRRKGREDEEN